MEGYVRKDLGKTIIKGDMQGRTGKILLSYLEKDAGRWNYRKMPGTRIERLNGVINEMWKKVDQNRLPAYIKSKTHNGEPVVKLQKILWILKELEPEAYAYLENNNVRITVASIDEKGELLVLIGLE